MEGIYQFKIKCREIRERTSMFTFKSPFKKNKLLNWQYDPVMLRNMCKTNFMLKGQK
jgi:hypothetical protein